MLDFKHRMRKKTTARRLDVKIEYKDRKLIQIIDAACSSNQYINEKDKKKYLHSAYEIREMRPGYHVQIIPVVIGCMGGGANKFRADNKSTGNRQAEDDKDLEKNAQDYTS